MVMWRRGRSWLLRLLGMVGIMGEEMAGAATEGTEVEVAMEEAATEVMEVAMEGLEGMEGMEGMETTIHRQTMAMAMETGIRIMGTATTTRTGGTTTRMEETMVEDEEAEETAIGITTRTRTITMETGTGTPMPMFMQMQEIEMRMAMEMEMATEVTRMQTAMAITTKIKAEKCQEPGVKNRTGTLATLKT
jgi:hypothetical protein